MSEMPPYFARLGRIVALFNKLLHQPHTMLVMRRN
jgi:hypothetical protein